MFKTSERRNTILGFAAILLWSTTVALVRSISEQIGPLTTGASVYMVGGILAVPFVLYNRKRRQSLRMLPKGYLFGCGALFIIYSTVLLIALGMAENRSQAVELGLLNYLWPVLTILFSLLFFSEKTSLLLLPGIVLAFSGIYFVLLQGMTFSWQGFMNRLISHPITYSLGLLAALSWALYSNLARYTAKDKGANGVPLFLLATGIVLYAMRFFFGENSIWNISVIAEIIVLGLATALAYIFWDAAMRKGNMILIVSASYLTPFFSTAFSLFYLNVKPGIGLWLGCLMIIIGSFLSWKSIDSRNTV